MTSRSLPCVGQLLTTTPLVLTGLRRALEHSEGIEVAGEAGNVEELMALIDRRHPQVVLLDLNMPGVRGTEHIEEVAERWPEVKVVVLSASEDRPSIDAALKAAAKKREENWVAMR